jgi:hypothetical protein
MPGQTEGALADPRGLGLRIACHAKDLNHEGETDEPNLVASRAQNPIFGS